MMRQGRRERCRSDRLNRTFDSRDEMEFAEYLSENQRCGSISQLEFQQTVRIGVRPFSITTRVDFTFFDERLHRQVWCEFKGASLGNFRKIRDAWRVSGPGLYRIARRRRSGPVSWVYEDIYPLIGQGVTDGSIGEKIARQYARWLPSEETTRLAFDIDSAMTTLALKARA